ncbi:MAG: xylulokinase [Frankiales bacterium]|jgi:sugar (pentulose or hexulose) kinase|nr:xylulokinase [Frankiales bacterium]
MSALGLDLGTSGCRAVVFDDDFTELASSQQPYEVHRLGGGRAELDPSDVLGRVASCIRAVNALVNASDPVTVISVSALGEAVVAVDKAGQPLGNSPVSADLRGAEITVAIAAKLGPDHWRSLTGQPVHPMFSIGKIACWRGDRSFWDATARVHTFADLVTTWLGGRPAIDYTSAARTAAFDVTRREWSQDVLDIAGVDASLLPEPVAVGAALGSVTARQRSELGFAAEAAIFAGAHDQACAFWGGGGTVRDAVFSLGTTECLTTSSTERPEAFIQSNIASYPVDDGAEWLSLNGIPSGGSTLHWLTGLAGRALEQVGELVASIPDHPSPVLMLPHLAGSGTMDNDPTATGVAVGLSLTTTAEDLAAALLESSGYELARSLAFAERAGAQFDSVRVLGGGSSTLASQRRADAADRTLTPVDGPSAARGAAAVALHGAGARTSRGTERFMTGAALDPRERDRQWYRRRREQFALLYPAIRSVVTTEEELTP